MKTADGEDDCSQMSTEAAWKPKCWQRKSLGNKEKEQQQQRKESKRKQIKEGTEIRELENCNVSMRQDYKNRKWKH